MLDSDDVLWLLVLCPTLLLDDELELWELLLELLWLLELRLLELLALLDDELLTLLDELLLAELSDRLCSELADELELEPLELLDTDSDWLLDCELVLCPTLLLDVLECELSDIVTLIDVLLWLLDDELL